MDEVLLRLIVDAHNYNKAISLSRDCLVISRISDRLEELGFVERDPNSKIYGTIKIIEGSFDPQPLVSLVGGK